jgi:uncharacterized protein YoxC
MVLVAVLQEMLVLVAVVETEELLEQTQALVEELPEKVTHLLTVYPVLEAPA